MNPAPKRVHNFNAGPAALPLPVLETIQQEFLDFKGSGMSITEISHRSKWFDEVINSAVARVKRLLQLDDRYKVLFLQGGASLQFTMIPMNFLNAERTADYVNTGTWSTKAIKEAKILGKNIRVAASSEDRNFAYIPKNIEFTRSATYAHITSNNTIKGTQWAQFPVTPVPLVADMSSDMFSRPFDARAFGLIYAGAQKNMGPAGVCLVIVRDDLLQLVPDTLPTMLKYTTHVKDGSMFNTPPCFSIYTIELVLKWLEETVGGMEAMSRLNSEKADLLYDAIDNSGFYRGTADKDSRSQMNVTFRLPDETLEKEFIAQATANQMEGLKGHRSVGGCRASLYNATSLKAVQDLVAFMADFQRRKG